MRLILLAFGAALLAQVQPGQLHLIPPPGVPVPEADQRQLHGALDRLGKRLDALKGKPNLADVQIFHKAVKYALDGNEFFTAEDIFRGKENGSPIRCITNSLSARKLLVFKWQNPDCRRGDDFPKASPGETSAPAAPQTRRCHADRQSGRKTKSVAPRVPELFARKNPPV